MYINTVFIFYIIALLISAICLVFIGLVFVQKHERHNEMYIAIRRFAVTVTLTNLLYFIFYYREVVRNQYELGIPFRVIDYTLCIAMFFCWMMVLLNMMGDSHRNMKKVIVAVTVIRLAASLLVTSAFMGDYYNIDDPQVRDIWGTCEMVFIILFMTILIYYSICGIAEISSRLRRRYIIFCSMLLLLWSVEQGIVDMGLFAGKYGVSAWKMGIPDLKGILLSMMNMATCMLVFKEDFSPLFFVASKTAEKGKGKAGKKSGGERNDENAVDEKRADSITEKPKVTVDEKLDLIAQDHRLTIREREVLKLLYQGKTNPQIGEALFISINTVKKHVKSIYEKLDVSSRPEVIHMINAQFSSAAIREDNGDDTIIPSQ